MRHRQDYPSAAELVRGLVEEYGEEVTTRTIQRDIEKMRGRGAPIEYDAQRHGFFYADMSWQLPGIDLTEGDLMALMAANKIGTVVCLAPEEQIAAESPEYAESRRRQKSERDGRGATGDVRVELIDVPIDDFDAPEPFVSGRFWRAANEIAERVENGGRVFVLCAAGIGRMGMFTVAVLMRQGYEYEEAYEEISAVGSGPEVPAQREFLKREFVQKGE